MIDHALGALGEQGLDILASVGAVAKQPLSPEKLPVLVEALVDALLRFFDEHGAIIRLHGTQRRQPNGVHALQRLAHTAENVLGLRQLSWLQKPGHPPVRLRRDWLPKDPRFQVRMESNGAAFSCDALERTPKFSEADVRG